MGLSPFLVDVGLDRVLCASYALVRADELDLRYNPRAESDKNADFEDFDRILEASYQKAGKYPVVFAEYLPVSLSTTL